ncbi:MAG: hypothetical protein IJH41_02000 [Eubacterium sp.]|nr:hypothetical protein [Eubacterium sp.]
MIIVDGDNAPGMNTRKINELDARDRLIIYYASDNKYYLNEVNRELLKQKAKCPIEFKVVKNGNCAVDFAVAMDLAVLLSIETEGTAALISEDKHFGTIADHAYKINNKWLVVRASTVEEVIKHYKFLESTSPAELHESLVKLFGPHHGASFYRRLKEMFREKNQLNEKMQKREPSHEFIGMSILKKILTH